MSYNNYAIIGDLNTATETEMQVCAYAYAAFDWVRRYTARGDFGGYDTISIVDAETFEVIATVVPNDPFE